MDKQQAQKIIRKTFENPFDKNVFIVFIKNLLNSVEEVPFSYHENYIPDAYKQYVRILNRIGKFSDGENNIDILVVTLKKETSLEHARTMQRNLVAWYLNSSRGGTMKDAALVAFVSPNKADWRFSLVKMDYKFEQTESGKMKVREEFTLARRWSFLVGVNEKSHTAQSRLISILANDEQDPTLQKIEEAFNIETVTNEFFLKYRELFLRTKEELDKIIKKHPKVQADFEAKNVDTVNFTKKLLGQIVFLYFLQKKGWFGVGRDAEWGEGSKHFLRELFEGKYGKYNNFFNDILEPLFYEALRLEHAGDYYSRFNCRIPFLNGGLFDPINDYDWWNTDILLPNDVFSNNRKTKEGDIGDGILDIFDRYNFTVKEDEPLEKEVAIDPELLGKAYEKFNAIRPDNFEEYKNVIKSGKRGDENKFNKQFGVYYTPREIVHYMCQESLINYLSTELDGRISKEDIETLIYIGEHVSEDESTVLLEEKLIEKNKHKTTRNRSALPENIRKNAKLIDLKLSDITVCDPAVGSGAFPVGMMNEIIWARNALTLYMDKNDKRTPYHFKRQAIQNCLYGVDIDPGAVEITKLRLWLSLIVDEEKRETIQPLPNLDYKIMQGNSLLSEFMGIDLDKEDDPLLLKQKDIIALIEKLKNKKVEYLNKASASEKQKLKQEIEDLVIKIFETKLQEQKANYFYRIKEIEEKTKNLPNKEQRENLIQREKEKLDKTSGFSLEQFEKQLREYTTGNQIRPFFPWRLYFAEVFHEKDGFDVVLANPPYIHIRTKSFDRKMLPSLQKSFKLAIGQFDLFILFTELSVRILKPRGIYSFIIPKRVLSNQNYEPMRRFYIKYLPIISYLDAQMPFEFTAVEANVLVAQKGKRERNVLKVNKFRQNQISEKSNIDLSLAEKMPFTSFPFSLNKEVISILLKISNGNNKLSHFVNIVRGYEFGFNNPAITKKKNKNSYELIRGENISKYHIQFDCFYIDRGLLVKKDFKDKSIFTPPKLVTRFVSNDLIFAYDEVGYHNTNVVYNLHPIENQVALKYLLALSNSTLLNFWFKNSFLNDDALFPHIQKNQLELIPIKKIPKDKQKPFIDLVDKILAITKDDDYLESPAKQAQVRKYEKQIDQLVYKLYNLTSEEIEIIEGKH